MMLKAKILKCMITTQQVVLLELGDETGESWARDHGNKDEKHILKCYFGQDLST